MIPLVKQCLPNTIEKVAIYQDGRKMPYQFRGYVANQILYVPFDVTVSELKRRNNHLFNTTPEMFCEEVGNLYSYEYRGDVAYIDVMFFREQLGITLVWELETSTLYIASQLHYDGYLRAPKDVFDSTMIGKYVGCYLYIDGEIKRTEYGTFYDLFVISSDLGEVVLRCNHSEEKSLVKEGILNTYRPRFIRNDYFAWVEGKKRFCFQLSVIEKQGTLTGELMEVFEIDNTRRVDNMIYTKENWRLFH